MCELKTVKVLFVNVGVVIMLMLIWSQLEPVLPAGNSREQHPNGGRNCFTMTRQSLWRVRFRMAIIPTPTRKRSGGEAVMWHKGNPGFRERERDRVYWASPSASVLSGLVVLLTLSQVLDENKTLTIN